uniref:Uncharacterized protein n=1 Tax=Knipowitschia caucasica TaxID=637954 RepID=A0AAV2JYF5_KNICA
MAARAHREAQCHSSFAILQLFLLILGLFTRNSSALTSYTRQELLDMVYTSLRTYRSRPSTTHPRSLQKTRGYAPHLADPVENVNKDGGNGAD